MADDETAAPDEQAATAPDEQTAEAPAEEAPVEEAPAEVSSEQPEGAQEAEVPDQTTTEERGSVENVVPEESTTEQGPAPEELDEQAEISVTEPEAAQEYAEEDEEQFEGLETEDDDDMMKALGAEQDSLDALVKSSSMQIAKERSMEPDMSSSMMIAKKMDKYAARTKDVLGEVIDIRKGSISGDAGDKRTARFMNTYKLDSDNPFNSQKVDKILKSVMDETFNELKYDPEKCCKEAKWASNTIKAKVKQMEFERYKIISVVSIGEKHNQDVLCTCRFLWDVERDNYSCYTLENPYVFGIALCFGLYYE